MIYLFICDVSNLSVLENIDLVSQERKAKVLQFKMEKDQKLILGSFLLLKKALKYLELDISLEFIYNDFGKPYFKNNSQYFFNLSHSETKVACAISTQEVGVDIQHIKNTKFSSSLAQWLLTPKEYNDLIEPLSLNEIYERWAIKESYIKCLGLSIFTIKNDQMTTFLNDQALQYLTYQFDEYWVALSFSRFDKVIINFYEECL